MDALRHPLSSKIPATWQWLPRRRSCFLPHNTVNIPTTPTTTSTTPNMTTTGCRVPGTQQRLTRVRIGSSRGRGSRRDTSRAPALPLPNRTQKTNEGLHRHATPLMDFSAPRHPYDMSTPITTSTTPKTQPIPFLGMSHDTPTTRFDTHDNIYHTQNSGVTGLHHSHSSV